MFPDPQPYFARLVDPRRETRNKLHKLCDILFIVLAAVLSGIEDWVNIEDFACEKEAWLRKFLELPNGIPSHDTLSDVFARLDPIQFSLMFNDWVEAELPSLAGRHLAVDGKALRGSRDEHGMDHIVTLFASAERWVLSQAAVREKSNEITAIPRVLSLLNIQGATVTIDAMGAQKEIAGLIVDVGAEYILALKGNHPTLNAAVAVRLDAAVRAEVLPCVMERDKGHGRFETRRYFLSDDVANLPGAEQWPGIAAFGMVESKREVPGKEPTTERRYFISSTTNLGTFSKCVRAHWAIENAQHWILDVQFDEDRNRARVGNSAKNLAVVRRMALNLLRRDENDKRSIRRRKSHAAFNDAYRTHLMQGAATA